MGIIFKLRVDATTFTQEEYLSPLSWTYVECQIILNGLWLAGAGPNPMKNNEGVAVKTKLTRVHSASVCAWNLPP